MANTNHLKNLLKKKGWTGKEVGKLLIASMLQDLKQKSQEHKEVLFSQSDFEKIEGSLNSDRDYITYGVYRDLYSSIIDSFNRGQGQYQQFFNGYYRLLLELREMKNADKAQKSINNTPLIMTEKQYKRLRAEAIKTLRNRKESFCSLMFRLLEMFLENGRNIPKAIKKVLQDTKKKSAIGNRFVLVYNEAYRKGYYSLPDGRRSDQMPDKEWQKIMDEEFLKRYKLIINEKPATLQETKLEYNQSCKMKACELFFKGIKTVKELILEQTGQPTQLTDERLEKALEDTIGSYANTIEFNPDTEEIEKILDFRMNYVQWHIYKEPPKDLTLYDLLEMYIVEYKDSYTIDSKEVLQHLRKDIPELYNAIKNFIEKNIPQARGLKANQLHEEIVSWGELADIGLYGYKELINPTDHEIIEIHTKNKDTTENLSKRLKGLNGIAIIKHPDKEQIDKNGDYIEKKSPLLFFRNLYKLESDTTLIENLHSYVKIFIYPALKYLYAFNALMEIIGKVYDLPELAKGTKYELTLFESQMNGFNDLLYLFYCFVYGNKEEKQHKRTIIKNAFSPLEYDNLKPSQNAIEEVTIELTNLGFSNEARKKLKYLDEFIDHLMESAEVV